MHKKIISAVLALTLMLSPVTDTYAANITESKGQQEENIVSSVSTDSDAVEGKDEESQENIEESEAEADSSEPVDLGIANSYIDIGERADYYSSPYSELSMNYAASLPVKYDSRDAGLVTSVKNQGSDGTCWAFAATGACESSMLAQGYATAPDYSEYQLAYFFYNYALDPLGNLKNDTTSIVSGNYNYLSLGGNNYFSMFALASWKGLVDEDKAPYADASVSSTLDSSLAFESDSAHLQNAYVINMQNADDVKSMIMEYGAVAGEMYISTYYANSLTNAYYQNVSTASNHAITIVGWDDSYDVSNFKTTIPDYTFPSTNTILPGVTVSGTPNSPGAWLVKNSWGEGYYDYIWVSYEDSCMSNANAFVFICETADNYDYNYQYDGTSAVYKIGSIPNNGAVSNVYTVSGADTQQIEAASIALYDDNVAYSLQFYLNPEDDNPLSGTPILDMPQTGVTTYKGYYTVELEHPFLVKTGDKVAVVFTLLNMDDMGESGRVRYFADMDWTLQSVVSFDSYTEPNRMYAIYDGEAMDLYDESTDFCPRIKMFSSKANNTVVSVNQFNINAIAAQAYTGSAIEPAISVTYDGLRLIEGTDFSVSYSNNKNVGTGTIKITGLRFYEGTRTVYFTIVPVSASSFTVSSIATKSYTGKAIKPAPTIRYNGLLLKNGTDYTLTYSNNTKPGTATITIRGKGNYTGTKKVTFKITGKISGASVGKIGTKSYTGKAIKPTPTIRFNGILLKNGTDYTLTYSNNTKPGTATITIKGKGKYTGTKKVTFKIIGKISGASVGIIGTKSYTGKAIKPTPIIRFNGILLKNGTDYTLTYSNNTKPGTATITIKGKGKYTGTKKVTFNIIAKKNFTTIYNGVDYSAVYDYNYYVTKNPDVWKAFGTDDAAALAHFVNYGMAEGRRASEGFNVLNYKKRYTDLQSVFGNDLKAYYLHYITCGKKEGRNGK